MKLFNSLTRKKEDFKPIQEKSVGMYTCGPTVYHYVTIGNWRTYTLADLLSRTLKFLNYEVKTVMNITDVGHLSGDNDGDSSTGEDRMEKAEKREGKNAWEIAEFYTKDFLEGLDKLNIQKPDVICKATDYIAEQIEMVQKIEKKGFTYTIESDGIYFDVAKYESEGNEYGVLSNLDQLKEGARVAINENKKDPRDFALWKFSPKDKKRHMEWESPWGMGFPGWHIECSAMSTKILGEQFDLHVGGDDLKSTHHPCEIAQSEVATGKIPFVKYWIHGAFLLVDGGKMGKSLGNAYTIQDIESKGYSPMHLRYFYLTGHYKKQINFTWETLESAKVAYEKLANHYQSLSNESEGQENEEYRTKFIEAISDDLNMPKALAVVWEMLKSEISDTEKFATLQKFDLVLGLDLENQSKNQPAQISSELKDLVEQRKKAREDKNWEEADRIRDLLVNEYGFSPQDNSIN